MKEGGDGNKSLSDTHGIAVLAHEAKMVAMVEEQFVGLHTVLSRSQAYGNFVRRIGLWLILGTCDEKVVLNTTVLSPPHVVMCVVEM